MEREEYECKLARKKKKEKEWKYNIERNGKEK